jgi:nucleotide-binding universal stress UspA family protein
VILVGRPAPVLAGPAQRIVVGVDGSAEATRAVQAAAAVAAVWGAPLLLVCAVDPGDAGAGAGIGGHVRHDPVSVVEGGRIARAAEEHARSTAPGVPVTSEVVTGRAHAVLAQAARDSGLVVVGRRGHGAERTLILGSVARALLRTVPAPLAVVSMHAHSREDVAPLRLVRSSRLAVPLGQRDGHAPRIPASQAVPGESA